MARPVTRKDDIERHALSLFVRKGIEGTTIRDIARSGGLGEGTMYRHWSSKDDLALDLFERRLRTFLSDLEPILANEPTTEGRFLAAVRRFFEFYDRDPDLFKFLLLTQHELLRKVPHEMPTAATVIRGMILYGQERAQVREGPIDLLTAMVTGMILQVAVSHAYGTCEGPLAPRTDEVVRSVMRVLAPAAAAQ